ncbi:MAG: type II secretory pathway protein ExeA [Rhodocyclaceae bacterium]|nr:MAG: type II secretory pathway protein ExeA [Rhodocyclaceae bacterium]TND00038.1 MAG: type II secretory pathway protein ExeA [Rhodocyclaceae bacterium]
MYLEHFGLNEPPFRITPHTDFFFDGANRGATLDALIYAITHDEGIVKVSGEVGSGKTMLCRVLMERLPESVTIIYLANPSLSREDILYAIADELRLDVPENARSSMVLRALQDHLIKSFGEGRQVVVLIDEAHAMPVETLEEIRLLSNLEANRNKLLQLVLFGQPELNDVLARPDMRQLKERITHNFGLEPLVRDDITHYLDFRMRAAGYRGPSVFSAPALKMIAQSSLGLTRRINILADKSLLAAFSSGSHQIGPKEIRAAIRDCEFSEATYGGKAARKPQAIWLAAVLALAALAAIAWMSIALRTDGGVPATAIAAPPAPARAVGAASAVPAAAGTEQTAPPGTASALPPSADTPPAPGSAPAQSPAAPPASLVAESSPSPATSPPAAGAPLPLPAVKPAPAAAALPPNATKPSIGPLTLEHLQAGHAWLEKLPNDRWFIQVFATDAGRHGEIETLLRRLSSGKTDMGNVHVYYSELSGTPRYGVIYGDFATREAASAAIRGLPSALRVNKPYPRQVVRLR